MTDAAWRLATGIGQRTRDYSLLLGTWLSGRLLASRGRIVCLRLSSAPTSSEHNGAALVEVTLIGGLSAPPSRWESEEPTPKGYLRIFGRLVQRLGYQTSTTCVAPLERS